MIDKPTSSDEKTTLMAKVMKVVTFVVDKIKAFPPIDHFIRAADRFNDRLGSQFGAAITYFSFLSLIPILMVLFAAAGFILASNASLLNSIIDKIVAGVTDPSLATTLKNTVNIAISQRTTVGLSGLAIALYSGVSWMGNLREAIRAQTRDVWERKPEDKDHFLLQYLKDFVGLTGLVAALIFTVVLTSVAGSAQATIVHALGLEDITWLRPVLTATALTISICANYLMFLWIFWMLPKRRFNRWALMKGTLLAAVGFEAIKFAMTFMLPKLASSPSGAAFGSIIGLMAFFYFFARLTLFCAAWIATANEHRTTPITDEE
ncbi:inner membrane protein YhjD [Photobacterium leiognathi]|uniref:inner membrane protein YhjD n=1 Tax=Photobacterium leiognathi TaxID=553611 RepID=UPI000319F137|nr:inner membrane protein YhjD [Photobacterium leiognathi]PSW53847.1 inner membrane protein YhjD [Photobacterium leiognathi subsp. mandapamensis]